MRKIFFIFALAFIAFSSVSAEADIQFPVKELGNCASEEACISYCDNSANIERCLNFAEKNNLMSPEEISQARKFVAIGEGPGGCTTDESCEKYCNSASNIKECIIFAEKHGLMTGDELKEAKQVLKALDSGVSSPGGCTSEKSCDDYCDNEANILECVTFAEAAGFISSEEAAMARKTGGKGPGGCKRDECETFCENPDNQEACYKFAVENGLMSEEMQKGSQDFMNSLKNAPEEVKACMKETFGDLGKIFPGPKTGAKLRDCYESFAKANPGKAYWPAKEGEQNESWEGPGGCKNREECDAYCIANPDACQPEGSDPNERRQEEPNRPGEGMNPPDGYERGEMPGPGQFPPEGQFQPREGENMLPPPGNNIDQSQTTPSAESSSQTETQAENRTETDSSSDYSPAPSPSEETRPAEPSETAPVSALDVFMQAANGLFGIK